MADAIAHRGPDAGGFWDAPGIGLAHRRLSIIDLPGGSQPLANEDGSIRVVFNGEIYNHDLLRDELKGHGHQFRTRSDTEVLVHLYEQYEDRLVEKLRGMFAFAIWDQRRRRLLLARDRVGIKPLYVYRDSEKLLFASELKAILADPTIPREIDPESLENYLALGMVPGPKTIFKGIRKLRTAHTLAVGSAGEENPRCYWSLRFEPDPNPTAGEWQEAIDSKLEETVRLHLTSDVPVGAFLSGGLDSSAILAFSSRFTDAPLQTFSIGFHEEKFSELPEARRTAAFFGAKHHEETVTPDAVSLLGEISHYFDEPFADPSAIPTFLLARLASRSVKVALSGDGGDELFGGYARYPHDLNEARMRRALPNWFRRRALSPLAGRWPQTDWLPQQLRAKTRLTNLSLDAADAYANTMMVCRPPLRRRLLHADVAATLNGHSAEHLVRDAYAASAPDDPLGGMIAADMATVLPDDFLVKVDRASMAHGVEVRPPFLDHELLELAARMPSHFKVRNGETKWIFKRVCRGRLPDRTINRPKQGFDIPLDAWLRGPLRDIFQSTVLSPHSPLAALVDLNMAKTLHEQHRAGSSRHGKTLWSLLVLANWSERYLGSRRAPSPSYNA
jgi:asparagine synthase (glutamine-hydrolysing)